MSNNNNISNAKKSSTSDFICTLKFSNTLPDLPFEPKLLTVPLDPSRLYKFQPENSLERDYKHTIIPESDLGIPLNLVDPLTFQCSPQLKARGLQKRDQQLLTEEFKEKKTDHSVIPWLRKTEYMTNDFSQEQLYGRSVSKPKSNNEFVELSIEEQVEMIEKSFESAQHRPVHPTKPGLAPVSITPLFPDFTHWRSRFSQVIFDKDPGDYIDKNDENYDVKKQEQEDLIGSGLISAFKTSKQEDYAIFLVPKLDEFSDVLSFKSMPEEEREYKYIREYTFNIISDNQTKRDVIFTFDEENDVAHYNFIESKVDLKRRIKGADDEESFATSGISVIKMALASEDDARHIYQERLSSINPVVIVDEDENMDEMNNNNNNNNNINNNNNNNNDNNKHNDDDDKMVEENNVPSPNNEEKEDDDSEDSDDDVDIFGDDA